MTRYPWFMSQGTVVALFRKVTSDKLERTETLRVVEGRGIEGDVYFGRNERQILFISTEELNAFGYGPGDWSEQVTVNISGLQGLKKGTPVTVGNVPFEVEQDCAPCKHLAERFGQNPAEFVKKTVGKRGMFLRPVGSGELRVGDAILIGGA